MGNERDRASKFIIILLPEEIETAEAYVSLINLVTYQSEDTSHMASLIQGTPVVSLCTRQNLLQNHLTVLEHIQLVLALYGDQENENIDQWLYHGNLMDRRAEHIHNLTKVQHRSLSLLLALLPDPDFLFIDDLTDGLSAPASQEVWQLLKSTPVRQGRVVLYATRDLQAARILEADEVWLMKDGRVMHKWPGGNLPPVLSTATAFLLEFDSAKSAAQFQGTIHDQPKRLGVLHSQSVKTDTTAVTVYVDATQRLVDLLLIAGPALINFRTHPLQVGELLARWESPDWEYTAQSNPVKTNGTTQHAIKLEGRKRRQAWVQIGLSEWRRHFRGFWRWGNILLSNLLPLGLLSNLVSGLGIMSTDKFLSLAAITLTASAGLSVGWGIEVMSRLALTADTTRTAPDKPTICPGPTQPFTPLFLFDISPIGRSGLLIGLVLGQWLIHLCHAGPLLILWTIAFPDSSFIGVSLLFWLLVTLVGLALAILLGRLARTPAQCRLFGWLAYLGLLFTAVALKWVPDTWQTAAWLWPFTGFTVAFRDSLGPDSSLVGTTIPFLVASVGTVCLWWAGVRYFFRRPSIWSATK